MKFQKEKVFELAKVVTVENNLFFIDDIIAFMPCSCTTFYELFPANSEESEFLKALLVKNRVSLKLQMRRNWQDNPAPALQMGLMKLICTDEERKKLSMSHNDITTNGKDVVEPITYVKLNSNDI